MTLSYPNVEAPIGMGIRKGAQACSVNHRSRNSADGAIQLCFFLKCLGKCLCISKGLRGSLSRSACSNIIGTRTVETGRIGLSRTVTRTLFGNHVHQNGNIGF